MDSFTSSTAEAVASIGTNKVKEVFSSAFNSKSLRNWSLFCDRSKFTIPKVVDLPSRLKSNLFHFQTNYMAVFLLLAIYSILTNPLFLIAVMFCGGLWYYIFRWRTEPLKIGKYIISDTQKLVALGIVTLMIFYIASVGNTIFWLLGATVTVVFLHALFYVPVEENDLIQSFTAMNFTEAHTQQV